MELFPEVSNSAPKWQDERGWLQILYESDNTVLKRSFSKAGVFRGLHVQYEPSPQVKIIRVVEGEILDFVVSLDDNSRKIHKQKITPENEWIRIDAHFAHGFYALTDTIFEYVCDGGYDEQSEQAFSITEYLANELGLSDLILSEKDKASRPLT
jgi:dTDP-4-dehydrorhamnose 3,5-epimerase